MITVLVIAESADNCIKTVIICFLSVYQFVAFGAYVIYNIFLASQMLRNCKVARVLPRVADCAKNDRNSILRARYDYAFYILLYFK